MHIVACKNAFYLCIKTEVYDDKEEILSIEEYCAEHKVSNRKRLEDLIYPSGTFIRRRKCIEMRMNKMPSLDSSSSCHLANMSLKQCYRLVLPGNPANCASLSKIRAGAILP